MKPTGHNFISDEHFDVLLRHALLDTTTNFTESNNDLKTSEAMATHIFSHTDFTNTDFTDSAYDNQSIVEKLVKDFEPKRNNFRLNIFLLSFFTIVTIALVIFFTSQKKEIPPSQNFIPVVIQHNQVDSSPSVITHEQLADNPLPCRNPLSLFLIDSCDDSDLATVQHQDNSYSPSSMTTFHIPKDNYKHYEDIPVLTEDEKIKTAKDKLKMMKDIAKKKTFGNLPPGKTSVNGEMKSVDGFSIENSEVSNLEYRTFLNDLLIQGKFDDYLLAAPAKGGWTSVGIPEFENVYFENIKYNDFPATNMTRKGAELYCDWLTVSMKDAISKKEVKWSGDKMPDFRLPNNVEWIYAARGCDSTAMKYPWGKVVPDSVQNHNGCFLCNFNYSASKDYFAGKHICAGYSKLKQGGYHRSIVTTAGLAIDTLLTAPVYSYNPNTTGQYGTMGNVSEMVWTFDSGNPLAKGAARSMGGNWNSYVEDVQIEAKEQYVGLTDASPLIGFRPLMNGYYNYSMIKTIKLK